MTGLLLRDFKEVLERNPRFQYGTVVVYMGAIRELLEKYGENPTIDQLNSFIAYKCQRRQPQVKYAIKEFLVMQGRKSDYPLLVQAKIRAPVRQKVFLPKLKLMEIASRIIKEPYRTIGKIQMATAARSVGVITLERKKVVREEGRIRLTLMEKGDKPNVVYLRPDFWPMLEKHITPAKKYLFLPPQANTYTREDKEKAVKTIYKRYLERLQGAAKECGIEMATHDIRRSVATIVRNTTNDPFVVKNMLNHSSLAVTEKYLADESEKVSDVLLKHQEGI